MEMQMTRLTKRIPVETETRANLSRLKEPGETFDALLNRLMEIEAGVRLSQELQNLKIEGNFKEFH
jgi:hypothetical protein